MVKHTVKPEIVINQNFSGMFNPTEFGSESCVPGHSYGPSIRTYWLLHYVVYGFGRFVREGKTWEIKPGEIFVIPPYVETYYEADMQRPWRYIWIGFSTQEEIPSVFQKPVIRAAGLGLIFEDMLRCGEMEGGRSAFLCGKLWELFGILQDQRETSTDYIEKALGCMNSEYANGITVRQVAERLNLNRSYFSSMFREKMGISPQKYLIDLRLKQAAELLTVHGASPSTAGMSVGYPDLYHFSKIFKQHFGIPPREYKRRYQEGA